MTAVTGKNQYQSTPELRFPGFDGGWKGKKLKEICNVKGGKRLPKGYSLQAKETKHPYITVSDMKNGTVSLGNIKYVPSEIASKIQRYTISSEDLFVSVAGTLGFVGIVPKELDGANLTENADKLTNLECDKKFLFHYLKGDNLKCLIHAVKTENAQPKLALYALENMPVYLPPKPEQQKIAIFLSSVDEWIERLRSEKEAWEKYKKGIMQKIFAQENRFKDDDGNDFPEWKEKRLRDIAAFSKGREVAKKDVVKNGKNKCVLYGELYTKYNEVINEVDSYTNIPKLESVVSEGHEVLIPSSGETALDIATASCIKESGIILGGDINILRFYDEQHSEFFAYYLSHAVKKNLARLGQGVSVVHLYASHLKELAIAEPCIKEQQKIADFLTSLDKVVESKQQQIAQAEQWKKGLMQKMFV